MKTQRRETGIPGLDSMIMGGFPVPSSILVAGEPGTGKTTFAVQSLFSNAKKFGTALYVTAISEPQWVVQKFLSQFKFYDQDLVDSGKVVFMDIGRILSEKPKDILQILERTVEQYTPKTLVIDPITPLKEILISHNIFREFIHEFFAFMKTMDCITLITAELAYSDIPRSIEAYMVDGILMMSYPEEDRVRRKFLEVLKMRGTKHTTGKQLIDISSEGMAVQAGLR